MGGASARVARLCKFVRAAGKLLPITLLVEAYMTAYSLGFSALLSAWTLLAYELPGRLTAAGLMLLVGLIVLKLNSMLSKRLDRGFAEARRRAGLQKDRFSSIFTWQRWSGYLPGFRKAA